MTYSENFYRQDVFLNDLRAQKDRQQQRIWSEHQQMQLSFWSAMDLSLPPLSLIWMWPDAFGISFDSIN